MTREIKSKPRSSLTEASKEGVKILQALLDTLREREEREFQATGKRKWWTVESIEEVALNIKDHEDKVGGPENANSGLFHNVHQTAPQKDN